MIEVLNTFLDPIRTRRSQYAQDPQAVMNILLEGSAAVRTIAAETMDEVRQVMHLDYLRS